MGNDYQLWSYYTYCMLILWWSFLYYLLNVNGKKVFCSNSPVLFSNISPKCRLHYDTSRFSYAWMLGWKWSALKLLITDLSATVIHQTAVHCLHKAYYLLAGTLCSETFEE